MGCSTLSSLCWSVSSNVNKECAKVANCLFIFPHDRTRQLRCLVLSSTRVLASQKSQLGFMCNVVSRQQNIQASNLLRVPELLECMCLSSSTLNATFGTSITAIGNDWLRYILLSFWSSNPSEFNPPSPLGIYQLNVHHPFLPVFAKGQEKSKRQPFPKSNIKSKVLVNRGNATAQDVLDPDKWGVRMRWKVESHPFPLKGFDLISGTLNLILPLMLFRDMKRFLFHGVQQNLSKGVSTTFSTQRLGF